LTFEKRFGLLFLFGGKAIRTGNAFLKAIVQQVICRERREARIALIAGRFAQIGVHADTLIEDKALSLVMGSADLFEIFENAAVELIDVLEAVLQHQGGRLLAADSARAERDNRLFL
jgi:hypothetical protein